MWIGLWWIILGILSSVGLGLSLSFRFVILSESQPSLFCVVQHNNVFRSFILLGTGLHTFVLYLGPLIAKTTIAASECNSLDFHLYGPDRFLCPPESSISNENEVS